MRSGMKGAQGEQYADDAGLFLSVKFYRFRRDLAHSAKGAKNDAVPLGYTEKICPKGFQIIFV
jgi:hypothetical protein